MRAQAEGSGSAVNRGPDNTRMLRKIYAQESRIGGGDMCALRCVSAGSSAIKFPRRSRMLAEASNVAICLCRSFG
jgi:hypothetical protein